AATTITSARASCSTWRAAAASSGNLPSSRRLRGCATGMPCTWASCLTGEACSFMPRPAGRSGWVSTSGTVMPAFSIAASAVAANSGVPAKIARIAIGSAALLVFARLLDHLGLDAVALQRAQVLDEDLAHQVIHLVLNADGQQALGVELVRLA